MNTNSTDPFDFDTRWVRRSFDRAAGSYDSAAALQSTVRGALLGRLDLMAIEPRVIVDAGAGTGHGARALKRRYPKGHVIALDSSRCMLRSAERRLSWLRRFGRVCADARALPLPDGSVDLIVSNLMLPWCEPDAVLAEFRRVLKPPGLLSFTTLGPDTLCELRRAWARVDEGPHVNPFTDMHDIGDAMVRAGFASPVLDVERFTLEYTDVRHVASDLQGAGARNANPARLKGLTTPRKFAAMQTAYEQFRRDGRLPVTYEVVFAHAWAPDPAARRGSADPGELSLEEVKRQLKIRRGR